MYKWGGGGGVQRVTCGPTFSETGESGDGLQGWKRNHFWGSVNYSLHSLPILSCGPCVPDEW